MEDPWVLVYEGFDPEQEPLREALCTLGNGYFATRGAAAQSEADGVHYPGTYLAGGYNRLKTEVAGRIVENEDLVNLPNWLPLSFRVDGGGWFRVEDVKVLEYRQKLDMKQGLLRRETTFEDRAGRRSRLEDRRLVHMAEMHLAGQEMTLRAENWSGRVEIRSALDGRVRNSGVQRYQGLSNEHLVPLSSEALDKETVLLKVETNQSGLRVAQAARTRIFQDGEPVEVERTVFEEEGYIGQQLGLNIAVGSEIRVEKVVGLTTSRDHASTECGTEAVKANALAGSFEGLVKSHSLSWEHLWRRFEMAFHLPGEEDAQTKAILHLNLFHLLQTISMHSRDLDVGVPSRGWHGEAYRGHIFWDELFIFPLLNLRVPEITRSLLMYRYRRLDEARSAARAAGYRGAMYPWQSGSNGREESQEVHLNPKSGRWVPDHSHLQRHVNAAIVYNISQYYETTRDMEFLSFCGAEMILEIARFWSSIAEYNRNDDRYEIFGVMGPDEYHDGYPDARDPQGLDNNVYTNLMAVWVLAEALRVLDTLPKDRTLELRESLGLRDEELDRWRDISGKMRLVFHGDGILSQFEGYAALEEFDWEGYRRKYGDIQRLDRILEAEDDTPNRYKVSKQADVLMLFYLFSAETLQELFEGLGYPFDRDTIPRNIRYYMQRTSHGSTLSRVVHSWVIARSDRAKSWSLFREALQSDYRDIQGGTTPEGIHLGAMAGSVNILQEGYAGIEARRDVLWFNPCLPEEVDRLQMNIRYRGHCLEVDIRPGQFTVSAKRCFAKPIRIGFKEKVHELSEGRSKSFPLAEC